MAKLEAMIKPIPVALRHMATRIFAVMLGLLPALLLTTGILHWLRRRRTVQAA